jgi:hypothetical protein
MEQQAGPGGREIIRFRRGPASCGLGLATDAHWRRWHPFPPVLGALAQAILARSRDHQRTPGGRRDPPHGRRPNWAGNDRWFIVRGGFMLLRQDSCFIFQNCPTTRCPAEWIISTNL